MSEGSDIWESSHKRPIGSPMGQHSVVITSGSFENAAAEELAERRIVKARRCGSSSAAAFDNANVRPLLEMGLERDKDKTLKLADTHRRVVDALLKIVRQAPGGQISGASLCATLYKEYAVAKDVIVQEYKGLKNFLASSMLKDEVAYVSDQVCFTLC